MNIFASHLESQKYASKISVIDSATVPLIKLVVNLGYFSKRFIPLFNRNLNVDITFDDSSLFVE